jgi:hypothetical protein
MPTLRFQSAFSVLLFVACIAIGRWYIESREDVVRGTNDQRTTSIIRDCPSKTAAERVGQADLILEARVEMVVPGETYAEVYLRPGTIYKGEALRPLRILAKPTDQPSVSATQGFSQVRLEGQVQNELSFASGSQPYLLFLQRTPDGYTTSRCEGSRLLGSGLTESERAIVGVVQ